MAKGKLCCICGSDEYVRLDGKYNDYLCSKHYVQYKRYGEFKRTIFDKNEIIIKNDYSEMLLYDKHGNEIERCIIDTEDIGIIMNYKWHIGLRGYVISGSNKKMTKIHRLILDYNGDMYIDHIDLNPLNNRKSNLRICTPQQNAMNRGLSKNNISGFTGVYWSKNDKKWVSQIRYNRKSITLGSFINKDDAIKARKEAEKKYFGEYRCKINE